MTILAGVLALVNGLRGIFGGSSVALGPDVGFSHENVCGIIVLIFGIVAIAGGINALRGRNLSLSLAGAIFGMISGGLIGFWLGLGALILFAFFGEDI